MISLLYAVPECCSHIRCDFNTCYRDGVLLDRLYLFPVMCGKPEIVPTGFSHHRPDIGIPVCDLVG